MRTKDLIELAGNPNFISGIHNYCDRWCERCPFTGRCAVYAVEEADLDLDPATRDISNAAFWKKLAAIFSETQTMILAMADERGIDLRSDAPGLIPSQKEIQSDAANHPLAKAAEDYARAVTKWFEEESPAMELVSDTPEESSVAWESEDHADGDLDDYVAVIRWYQFFIAAKLIRALMSRVDEDEYLDDESARDSDGSTKAALIGIDRSIAAWKLMYDSRPEQSAAIQKLLLDLEKLRLSAEREFPEARDFIRPGLDELSLDFLH